MKPIEIWLPVLSAVLMLGGHASWRALSDPPAPPVPVVIQFESPIPRVTVDPAPPVSDHCGLIGPEGVYTRRQRGKEEWVL